MTDKYKNLRRFFRLPYPRAAQPPLTVDKDKAYRVLEVSELGIVLEQQANTPLQVGETVSGTIRFHDDHHEDIEGEVYRLDSRGVIVQLNRGISPRYMIKEQIYIKNAFPVFFRYTVQGKTK
ncbi:hypothetical protein [Zhongshania sp.]|uniref:hypothetical protein n=1 Tax=Zhongshania sp. TaxID=1971902 RepID=UPI003567D4DC